MTTVKFQSLDVVKCMLEAFDEHQVNFVSSLVGTPLIRAVEGKDLDVIKYLMETKGANVNLADQLQNSPLY
jgi:hypothetical protein